MRPVKRAVVLLGLALLIAGGAVGGWFASRELEDPETVTETITTTVTTTTATGDPVAGGAIAYWQELERTSDERPLATLAEILEMPYTLSRGIYVWPFAYDVESVDDLTAHERELLASLGPLDSLFVEGTGYVGWRAGIRADGSWVFYVAGD